MLLYGVSVDLHDEYFSIILMLISSHYMANYGSDPIWFTNLMVCVRIFLLAWVNGDKLFDSFDQRLKNFTESARRVSLFTVYGYYKQTWIHQDDLAEYSALYLLYKIHHYLAGSWKHLVLVDLAT